ncbi:hypothetical protein CYMTET_52241 [Cymbomonas tetramitiformis]|uniref:Uncharacterized protein n=1 Tax=Cymbomonas tetramitiformis TaxID=36881 RepID=A0AAE0BKK7_9CHLO|nr:hypothetical protein CYMTET_52241 [Cymbomonas tetramitiformis]
MEDENSSATRVKKLGVPLSANQAESCKSCKVSLDPLPDILPDFLLSIDGLTFTNESLSEVHLGQSETKLLNTQKDDDTALRRQLEDLQINTIWSLVETIPTDWHGLKKLLFLTRRQAAKMEFTNVDNFMGALGVQPDLRGRVSAPGGPAPIPRYAHWKSQGLQAFKAATNIF